MSLSAAETWTRLLDRAKREIPEQTYRTWLEPTEALSVDDATNVITVGVPDRFAADWNESKHAPLLASLAPVALGHPMSVVFTVHEERKTRPQMDLFVAPPANGPLMNQGPTAGRANGGAHEAAVPQGPNASAATLNQRYTFENFVVGKSNELAHAAATAAAVQPGRAYNPLFIYGDTGLGKTHLMQAVAHEMLKTKPMTRVTFVGTEQFTNEMVASIRERSQPDFRRRYRESDILLVDDVQFLKGKEATQEEFFHTFNALYEAGRQIIITSDRRPNEIPGLEARLVSRFEWGMVADVALPDLEHRIAILDRKMRLDHLERTVPEEVIHFVAYHVRASVRELEGSIIRLLAYASLRKREVTVELAREALRDKIRASDDDSPTDGPEAGLTPFVVQDAVAREWKTTVDGLRSKARTKNLTIPRQVAMYLIRELLGVGLVDIGQAFGGRDHSTVIHSIEKTEETMREDEAFAGRVARLRGELERLRG